MEYTEKIHAERLLQMLEKRDPCTCCPIGIMFMCGHGGIEIIADDSKSACLICRNFVGVTNNSCPCGFFDLDGDDVIKQTWLALEENGYI